jgi:hypothetical protein
MLAVARDVESSLARDTLLVDPAGLPEYRAMAGLWFENDFIAAHAANTGGIVAAKTGVKPELILK